MGKLVWDTIGKRKYQAGLDRGVLYLPDGTGVPWNGLTSVSETEAFDSEPIYFDGVKIHEHVVPGEFSGSITAVTYPDEFEELQGLDTINCGVSIGSQTLQRFSLCYRSLVGNDVKGLNHYKLHILYNLVATPSEKKYASLSDTPDTMEFSWDISAIPEVVPGHRPTAQITIDSRKTDAALLSYLESLLYGSDLGNDAALVSLANVINIATGWYRFRVTAGVGRWTGEERIDGDYIELGDDGYFEIHSPTAITIDEDSYTVESVLCVGPESLKLEVISRGVGSWTARTPYDGMIRVDEETGMFSIYDVEPDLVSSDSYRISNQFAEDL